MSKFNISSGKTSLVVGAVIILMICFAFRCYRFQDREALHIDEAMSVVISNVKTIGWGEPFDDDSRMFTGDEMKRAFYSGDNSVLGTMRGVAALWKDTRDPVHSNMYYILLKISFMGADTGDYNQLMHRAAGLNLLLFMISFFFVFCTLRLLFNNNWVIWGILAVAFLNYGSIYSTFNFREYQFQELTFSALTYISAVLFFRICNKEELHGKSQLIVYALVMALAFHAGYFGVAYILMLWGGLLLITMVKKERKSSVFLIFSLLLSLAFVLIIYPNFLSAIGSDRGDEAMEKFDLSIITNFYRGIIKPSFAQFERYYLGAFKLVFLFILIAIGAGWVYSRDRKFSLEMKFCACLVLVSFIWITLVVIFSPWKGAHYYRAVFPVLTVGLMGLLFLPKIKLYYPLLALIPAYLFWVSMLNIEKYPEYKDNTPIVFMGETDYYDQYYLHELFNSDRLIGFSQDRENMEKKMEQLGNHAAVGVFLDNIFSHYTGERSTASLENFYKYVDTTKYQVEGRQFHRSFITFFLLNKRDSNLVHDTQKYENKDFLKN